MRADFTTITPEMAMDILSTRNNINIRAINKQNVQIYARQMLDGKWHHSWDAIVFDKDGNLLNGQHRLAACAKAGMPIVDALVIYDAVDITGDTGRKRTVKEALKGFGYELPDVYNNNLGTAVIRDVLETYYGKKQATPDECLEASMQPGMVKSSEITRILSGAKPGIKRANVASAIIGAYIITKDPRIIDFCEILKSGAMASDNDVNIIALRDWLIETRHKTGSVYKTTTAMQIRGTVQWVIQGYLIGRKTKRINKKDTLIYRPSEEDFLEEW